MEVTSHFPNDRHRKNLQLQEPVDCSTPKCSQVKSYSLQKNRPLPSVDHDFPRRRSRRPISNQILELIDQKVSEYKLHLASRSAPPSRRFASDKHSPSKVSFSVPSPSNAVSEPTISNFQQEEVPRQSPRFQLLERPFSASRQLQEEEDLNVVSEPQCCSAERGSASSRLSEFPRHVLDIDGTEIKENIPVVNFEPNVHSRVNPAADHTRQSQTKSIRLTSTKQGRSQIISEIAAEAVSLLCSKGTVATGSPQNKPKGGICQNPVVQISENPQDVDESELRRPPQPILYEDISEEETEIYPSDAEGDAGPCVVLDFDVDDDYDDWEVLPVSILSLKFQPSDKHTLLDNEEKERALGSRPHGASANVIPASAFTQMKVFDTPDQQEEAVKFGKLSFVIPATNEPTFVEVERKGEHCSDLEDCNDTEDSNDYSPGPECNLMTVSLQRLKDFPCPSSPEVKLEKEIKERTTTPEKGWKAGVQNHQSSVIVLDSSDESDDNLEVINHQPARDDSENNQMDRFKMHTHHDARGKASFVDLDGREDHGQSIIILSDSDSDSSVTPISESTKLTSAASPSQNMTADSPAGFPLPETITEVCEAKKYKRKTRALTPERQLEINSTNAEKCPQLARASPVKMTEKLSSPEHQNSIIPQFYIQKRPHQQIQLAQRPSIPRQAEDQSTSNPIPSPASCKEDRANQRARKSVLRSKSYPFSRSSIAQKSVSFSASSASKTSNSSEGRSSSSAVLPVNPARSKVCSDWQDSYFSIRKKNKNLKEVDLRTKASNLPAETRPQPSRVPRRRNSHEAAPLMKKTKLKAIECTRARNCTTPADPRYPVGEGYKWKNPTQHGSKARVGQPRTRQSLTGSPFSDSSF